MFAASDESAWCAQDFGIGQGEFGPHGQDLTVIAIDDGELRLQLLVDLRPNLGSSA